MDQYAQLHVDGILKCPSNLWLSSTPIELANLTERKIVSLQGDMAAGNRATMILGRSLSSFDSAIMAYTWQGTSSVNTRLSLGFYGYDNALNIMASGYVGIGTTSPRAGLEISSSNNGSLTFGAGGIPYAVYQHSLNNNPISSSLAQGSFGPYTVSGVSAIFNGIVFTQSVYATSDRRLKENIESLDVDIEQYKKIRPVSYNYKADTQKKTKFGLIAQEAIEVSKELVELMPNEEKEDGVQLNIDYSQLSVINCDVIKKILKRLEDCASALVRANERLEFLENITSNR